MEEAGANQGVFDFESGNTDGFENWRRQQEERLEAIRNEWGLPIGRRVRMQLVSIRGELEGRLRLREMPVSIDRRIPLRLRVDEIDVTLSDIEHCTLIE